MLVEAFGRVANLLPEPMLLVTREGDVRAANKPAAVLLNYTSADALVARNLSELAADSPQNIHAYLLACARSTNLRPGLLTFSISNGNVVVCRIQGTLLQGKDSTNPGLILLRLTRKEDSRFIELNKRIESLGHEIVRRKRLEVELA